MWMNRILACALLLSASATGALAQQAAPAAAAIEPRATALLEAMSRRLAEAQTLSFTARIVYDVPTAEKTPIFLTTVSTVSFKRPNKLRVSTLGDGPSSVFIADGAKKARFDPATNMLSTRAAPTGLAELLQSAGEHGIDLPFADVLLEKPFGDLSKGVTSAFVVGQSSMVGGVRTNIVSVSDARGHMQLWIGADDNLPRQVWVTETREGQTTRNMMAFTNWTVNRPMRDNLFSIARYNKARQIELKPVAVID